MGQLSNSPLADLAGRPHALRCGHVRVRLSKRAGNAAALLSYRAGRAHEYASAFGTQNRAAANNPTFQANHQCRQEEPPLVVVATVS